MILGPRARGAPPVLALGLEDRQVVDRGDAPADQNALVDVRVLVAVGAAPVTRIGAPPRARAAPPGRARSLSQRRPRRETGWRRTRRPGSDRGAARRPASRRPLRCAGAERTP